MLCYDLFLYGREFEKYKNYIGGNQFSATELYTPNLYIRGIFAPNTPNAPHDLQPTRKYIRPTANIKSNRFARGCDSRRLCASRRSQGRLFPFNNACAAHICTEDAELTGWSTSCQTTRRDDASEHTRVSGGVESSSIPLRCRTRCQPVPGHGLSHAPGSECGAAARAAAPSGQVADEVGGVGD